MPLVMLVVTLVVLGLAAPLCNGTSFGKMTAKTVTKAENKPSFNIDEHYQDIRNFGKKSIRRKSNKLLASSDAYRGRIAKNKKMSSEEREVIRKFETRRQQKVWEKNKKLRTVYSSNQDSECQ